MGVRAHTTFDVAVIGAGLAGGSTAYALARRGARVVVIDSLPQVAGKSSGNLFGLITPYLAKKRSPHEALYAAGYSFTHDLLRSHSACAASFRATGALQLPSAQRLVSLLQSDEPILGAPHVRRVAASQASALAGIPIHSGALYIPDAGFLAPREFVTALLTHTSQAITLAVSAECTAIERDTDHWRIVLSQGGTVRTPVVVVCTAHEATRCAHTAWLPLEAIRGQTMCVTENVDSAALRCVISYGGYITPAVQHSHFIGAHYQHDDQELLPRDTDTISVLERCTEALPHLRFSLPYAHNARVCFRTSTFDRLPYIGAVPDYRSFLDSTSRYRSGTTIRDKVVVECYPGMYVNVGHGSRGLLSAPVGGEIVARLVTNEALENLAEISPLIDPARLPWRLLNAA